MLLRASGQTHNRTYQLATVTGTGEGDSGVPDGRFLVAFAEAVLGEDDDALVRARDAAGVVGLFNAIDRVADATGIPLEPEKAAASLDFRAALDLDRFAVANRS